MKNITRETIRKGTKDYKDVGVFLYGKLRKISKAVAYCELHKCYLEPGDITNKGCKRKKCKYRQNIER